MPDKRSLALMLLFSSLLGATGQILFKIGVTSGLSGLVAFVCLGLVAYIAATAIYLFVLGHTHLSWAYSFGGLAYIFASIIAFLFLNEPVPPLRWVGISVIVIGTALIGIS